MFFKNKNLNKLLKIFLVLSISFVLLALFQKTTLAQSCCSVPSDCRPMAGYTATCDTHVAGCPQWRCFYSRSTGGGGDINWWDLERISAGRFANNSVGFIVTRLIVYLFPVAGLLLLIYLIYGGYRFLFSGGDPKSIQAAKGIITTALVGFIIVFVSFWIVQIIATMLGLESILTIF